MKEDKNLLIDIFYLPARTARPSRKVRAASRERQNQEVSAAKTRIKEIMERDGVSFMKARLAYLAE